MSKEAQIQNSIEQQKQYEKPITIGKAVFKSDFQFDLISQTQFSDVLKSNYWPIISQQYQLRNWKKIFQGIIQCQNKQLIIQNINNPQIIKQIHFVNFKQLSLLRLYENSIDNIECFQNIMFPFLKTLYLSQNHISRITSLKKLSIPSLQNIWLDGNNLTEIRSLAKLKINFDDIFAIKSWSFDLDIDLSLISKLNAQATDIAYYSPKNRIGQSRIESMLGIKILL